MSIPTIRWTSHSAVQQITINPLAPANQFEAWVIKHVVVEQSAQETWRIKDKARCRCVAEELWGRQIIYANHSLAVHV
jgi:hypothetical protein